MKRDDLARLFTAAREVCGHSDYVVLGSLAVLGYEGAVPPRMAASIDVDAYCRADPRRTFDLAKALGQGSRFEAEHGYYLDPVSPQVATFPPAWEARLVRIEVAPGLVLWFVEPNDVAVSKYARLEPRDREWIRPGLQEGILSLPILDTRFAATSFYDATEADRARSALEEDRRWLRRQKPRRKTVPRRRRSSTT